MLKGRREGSHLVPGVSNPMPLGNVHRISQSEGGWTFDSVSRSRRHRGVAGHSGLAVDSFFDGDKGHIPIPEEIRWENGTCMKSLGNLGQSVAVLRKVLELESIRQA